VLRNTEYYFKRGANVNTVLGNQRSGEHWATSVMIRVFVFCSFMSFQFTSVFIVLSLNFLVLCSWFACFMIHDLSSVFRCGHYSYPQYPWFLVSFPHLSSVQSIPAAVTSSSVPAVYISVFARSALLSLHVSLPFVFLSGFLVVLWFCFHISFGVLARLCFLLQFSINQV